MQESITQTKKVAPVDAGVKSGVKTRKDLDKLEKCAGCKTDFKRRDLRGSDQQDVWLCVPNGCWEKKFGRPAPGIDGKDAPPKVEVIGANG